MPLPTVSPAPPAYRGRFAPSPTGPLHFGSLVAAVGSYLDACAHRGEWLVRMEDVDTPRCVPGAAEGILASLEQHGFTWTQPVIFQSRRADDYAVALETLKAAGLAYPCACSRKEIADSASNPAIDGGLSYPGTCRAGLAKGKSPRAWRLRVNDQAISFTDRVQGMRSQQLEQDVGDFVLLRADGLFAYQLAVVADDAWQGITHVVRGADLLDSTPRQIWLQRGLGYPLPCYAHLPVATNAAGEKLSKQTLAPPLDSRQAAANLVQALIFLGQPVPRTLSRSSVNEVWQWAKENWSFANIPQQRSIPLKAA